MRVHVLQIAYGDDESVADRVKRVAGLVSEQEGADLVVLPELWAPTGMNYRLWAEAAEPVDGPTITAVAEAARSIGAVVHAGSIIEQGAPGEGPQGRDRWNTSVVIGRDGSTLEVYRKIHRFGFTAGEPALIEAGDTIKIIGLDDGSAGSRGGPPTDPSHLVRPAVVQLGLATCYDLRFPEMFRKLLDAGSSVVVVPAAWPLRRVDHWTVLGRARAIENQCVVIQCNTGGTHAGIAMGGHSQVVSAAGEVLAEAGEGEETLIVDVDVPAIAAWRKSFPVLADRMLP